MAALNFGAWATRAAGAPDVPVESLQVTLRRPADQSVALDSIFGFHPDTLKGDSAVVRLNVNLTQSTESFLLSVRAFGGGTTWYTASATVQVTAGTSASPATLPVQYVGPGASAVRVQLDTAPRRVVGGTTVPLRAYVYDASGSLMTGVPIGYRLSDSTRGTILYPTPFTATLTASPAVRDSVWLVAETPTHLKDSARVQIVPPAASLAKISGDNQTGIIGAALKAPLVVRVLDALNGGFKGDTVRWTVTTANATLSAAFSVSDDTGYATVSATPTALGTVTIQAAVTGLQGSPQTFTATATAGTVKQVIISPKLDTIARGTTLQYTAVAKDSLGNTVSTPFGWSSTNTTVATVNSSGLATALAGDSAKIVAAAGSAADTARLYVRALRTVTVAPADTVVTAVGDSFQLRTSAFDNFGAPVTTGFTQTFVSASPTVVTVTATTGRVRAVGPGNGVVVVRDSVDAALKVQASATIRVNQVTRAIYNRPGDSVVVGAGGQTTIVLRGSDSAVVGVSGQTQVVAVAVPLGVTVQ